MTWALLWMMGFVVGLASGIALARASRPTTCVRTHSGLPLPPWAGAVLGSSRADLERTRAGLDRTFQELKATLDEWEPPEEEEEQ